MDCKGVGFSVVQQKPVGARRIYTGTSFRKSVYDLERNRLDYFGRQAHFHARRHDDSHCAEVYRALGNDSDRDVIYMLLGAAPPKNFPAGNRTLLGDGIPNRNKVPRWKKQ